VTDKFRHPEGEQSEPRRMHGRGAQTVALRGSALCAEHTG
jgi:hypothetical protein